MAWCNYHTHSTYCDGKEPMEAVVAAAIEQGVVSLGFSSHGPLPFHRSWAMAGTRFDAYVENIRQLKQQYGRQLEIYAGLEADYVPGRVTPLDFAPRLDYVIGSVHMVDAFSNGDPWEIDGSQVLFESGVQQIFGGDVRMAVQRYFALTREMLRQYTPDILGHFDKIKMHNTTRPWFDESEDWYRSEIRTVLEEVKHAGCIVEVNTRGVYQKKTAEPYPSWWILEEMLRMDIPITLNSDAHHPKDLTGHFSEIATQLADIGYRHLHVLKAGEWLPIPFSAHGID